jgi:hypothetical protein
MNNDYKRLARAITPDEINTYLRARQVILARLSTSIGDIIAYPRLNDGAVHPALSILLG